MPIGAAEGILEVENAKFSASEFIATTSVGIGTTSASAYPLVIFKETEPEIRIQEGDTQSSGARFYSNNSNLYIQTGTDFSSGSSGDIAFQTMGGQATHVIVKSDGKVGVGTGSPRSVFHVKPPVNAAGTENDLLDFRGDFGINTHGFLGVRATTTHTNAIGHDLTFRGSTYNGTSTPNTSIIMSLKPTGNVGIGTASPDAPLEITSNRNADSWAKGNSIFNVLHDNNNGAYYGMSFAVSATHGDGIIQTYNVANGSAQYDLRLQPSGGNVGIGTTTPLAKLQVNGVGDINMAPADRQYFRYDYAGGWGWTYTSSGYGWGDTSIYATWAIVSGDHFISTNGTLNSSDERIKKNIVDADDAECLETLRLLKPKKYQYKDEIKSGTEPVWGFIAQEVREILPHATRLRKDVLPNIYELANVSQSNVITFVNFNTSNLESNATTLIRTKGIDGKDHDIHLVEVIDEHTIRVEEDLSAWTGSVDETGNVVAGNQLFVYGQEVDDFVFLKKDAIWTVATSALQEVDRQLQAEKAKVATLETQVADLLARVQALENP